ncbi:MAG: hypothetical protein RL661_1252, partial [Pseudomonadota bacterium]
MTVQSDRLLIQRFVDALWVEEGLSDNTQKAYSSDLQHFLGWLLSYRDRGLLAVDSGDIEDYLAIKFRQEASSRSMARLVSSLRKFFRYLIREGRLVDDPTLRIEPPRIGRPLPATLTELEVEALLNAISVDDMLGCRDR